MGLTASTALIMQPVAGGRGYALVVWKKKVCVRRAVADTLRRLRASSRRGFAVNFMAEKPDGEKTPGLYRTAPAPWVAFCHEALGCAVDVVDGYGMREFTLLARSPG